jgi:hypothetical protein
MKTNANRQIYIAINKDFKNQRVFSHGVTLGD